MLGLYSDATVLKFLVIFKQGTMHFHFALGCNYAAGPGQAFFFFFSWAGLFIALIITQLA